jgi:hypothetical protein
LLYAELYVLVCSSYGAGGMCSTLFVIIFFFENQKILGSANFVIHPLEAVPSPFFQFGKNLVKIVLYIRIYTISVMFVPLNRTALE